MKHRYKVRAHESGERDGATGEGTIVLHLGGSVAVEADSIDTVEGLVRKQIAAGKLPKGSVYQICPCGSAAETLRTFAVDLKGEVSACSLESAGGFYSDFRRIRYQSASAFTSSTATEGVLV